jgi:hypothetical protein
MVERIATDPHGISLRGHAVCLPHLFPTPPLGKHSKRHRGFVSDFRDRVRESRGAR